MSFAARIVPALEDLVAQLEAAGLHATATKARLRVPGAWVTPAHVDVVATLRGLGPATLRAEVYLVAPAQGELEALADLAGLLELALTVIDPDDDDGHAVDTSVVVPHNNNALPAFRLVVDLDLED
jgi:hypothetical protein